MKLSDIKGEQAIEVLADIIEPLSAILGDKEVAEAYKTESKAKAVSVALKKHKGDVLFVLATVEGCDPKKYQPSLLSLPAKMMDLLNDPEIRELFPSQGQKDGATPSGSATESTAETAEK